MSKVRLDQGTAVTGAIPMWNRIVDACVERAKLIIPAGSKVIEVGYGDGYLSCYLAQEFGWDIVGLDILPEAQAEAQAHAREFGLEDKLDFRLVKPEETWDHEGLYDAVFIKTVLYNATTLADYARWLDWVRSVLKPGGTFVNFENGKANLLTYLYRKVRGRYYADLCMYDSQIQQLYEDRFEILYKEHYGYVSQFVAPVAPVYALIAAIEEQLFQRTADNSYITALIGKPKADGK